MHRHKVDSMVRGAWKECTLMSLCAHILVSPSQEKNEGQEDWPQLQLPGTEGVAPSH